MLWWVSYNVWYVLFLKELKLNLVCIFWNVMYSLIAFAWYPSFHKSLNRSNICCLKDMSTLCCWKITSELFQIEICFLSCTYVKIKINMNLKSSGNYASGTDGPMHLDTLQSSLIWFCSSCTSHNLQAMVAECKGGCVWLFHICFQTF